MKNRDHVLILLLLVMKTVAASIYYLLTIYSPTETEAREFLWFLKGTISSWIISLDFHFMDLEMEALNSNSFI